jgi:hypothetical protein
MMQWHNHHTLGLSILCTVPSGTKLNTIHTLNFVVLLLILLPFLVFACVPALH